MTNNTMIDIILTELLNETYKKLEWKRSNFDFDAKIDNYEVHLIANKETTSLAIESKPFNADRCVVIDAKKDERVKTLYNKVFDYVNEMNTNNFLQGFYEVLRNKN